MKRWSSRRSLVALAAVPVLLVTACGGAATDQAASSPAPEVSEPAEASTVELDAPCVGPDGSPSVPANDITLTDDEIAQVASGGYTAAVTWAGSGPWYEAADAGFSAALDELAIERVATVSAEYDPAKQADDVQSVMTLEPDIVLGSPVDAVAAAEAYRPVVDAGTVLVLSDNTPAGYEAGRDYVGLVTGDRCRSGQMIADLMSEAIGGDGDIGMIFFDADFYVTNVLDQHFQAAIEQRHPDINIAAKQGFIEENGTQEIASAMIVQNPDIKAIYVTWSTAAQGVIAALREAGRSDVKVVTHDLDETNDLEMATNGILYGVATEVVYDIGYRLGYLAAYGILEREAPPYATVDMMKVTRSNLVEGWETALHRAPSEQIMAALE